MEKDPTPQAASPLATWLSYLEHLHSRTIDLGLTHVSEVIGRMDIVRPAPFVFTVAGTNSKGITRRMPEIVLMAVGYKVGVYSSLHLVRYTERVCTQGAELPEVAYTASFAEIEVARGDISLTYFEYDTPSALRLLKQAQLDVVILEVELGGRLGAINTVDVDVVVVTSIALDHTDWLGPDRESIGREKAGIFRAGKPAVVGESDMPHTIADVASEEDALLQRRGVDWCYEVEDEAWSFRDVAGALSRLPLPQMLLPNTVTAATALRASGLAVDDAILRGGVRDTVLPDRFQIINDTPRVIPDVAHNPHAAAYLARRLKTLAKMRRVLVVIGMLHDKDTVGVPANPIPDADVWYCAPLGGPYGMTAEQLVEHPRGGIVYTSVAQVWHVAMADAKVEDTVLVCGSFHTVAQVMEEIDAGRIGDE